MVEQGWGEVLRDCCLHLEPGSSLQAGRDALLVSWKCGSHAVRSRRGSICFVSGSLKFSKTQLKKYQKKLEMKYVCDRSRMNAYKLFYVLLRLAPEPGYMRQVILVAIKVRLHLLDGSTHTCMSHVFTVYMCIYVVFVGNSDSFRCAGS